MSAICGSVVTFNIHGYTQAHDCLVFDIDYFSCSDALIAFCLINTKILSNWEELGNDEE